MRMSSIQRIAWLAVKIFVVHASGSFGRGRLSFDLNSLVALQRGGTSEASSVTSLDPTSIESSVGVFLIGDHLDEVPVSLSWLIGADSSCGGSCVVLLGKGSESNIIPLARVSEFPQDYASKRSIGLLSDIIVIVLLGHADQYEAGLQELNEDLRKIVHERQARSLSKGRLVVVTDADSNSPWLEDIAQSQFPSFTPSLWDALDIVTPENLQKLPVSLFLPESIGTIEMLLPNERSVDGFAKLFEEVYLFKGGNKGGSPFCRVVSMTHETISDHITTNTNKKQPTIQAPVENSSTSENIDDQDKIEKALTGARKELADLESKMQEIQLDSTSNNPVPLFEFGDRSNAILIAVSRELSFLPISLQTGIIRGLLEEVHRLYQDQMQALRDYYGRRYEVSLEGEDDEAAWITEAEHVSEGFKAAADNAIPTLCRAGGVLAGTIQFDYLKALQGLLQDMMEATQDRKDQLGLTDDNEEVEELPPRRNSIPKWVKKLATRAFVLGVNYVQGWLAWQGLKRAAMERDREMPKFPLF